MPASLKPEVWRSLANIFILFIIHLSEGAPCTNKPCQEVNLPYPSTMNALDLPDMQYGIHLGKKILPSDEEREETIDSNRGAHSVSDGKGEPSTLLDWVGCFPQFQSWVMNRGHWPIWISLNRTVFLQLCISGDLPNSRFCGFCKNHEFGRFPLKNPGPCKKAWGLWKIRKTALNQWGRKSSSKQKSLGNPGILEHGGRARRGGGEDWQVALEVLPLPGNWQVASCQSLGRGGTCRAQSEVQRGPAMLHHETGAQCHARTMKYGGNLCTSFHALSWVTIQYEDD